MTADIFRRETNMKCNIDIKTRGVAFALRSKILKSQRTLLPCKTSQKKKYKYWILLIRFSATLYVALIFSMQNQQVKLEELNQLVKMGFLL